MTPTTRWVGSSFGNLSLAAWTNLLLAASRDNFYINPAGVQFGYLSGGNMTLSEVLVTIAKSLLTEGPPGTWNSNLVDSVSGVAAADLLEKIRYSQYSGPGTGTTTANWLASIFPLLSDSGQSVAYWAQHGATSAFNIDADLNYGGNSNAKWLSLIDEALLSSNTTSGTGSMIENLYNALTWWSGQISYQVTERHHAAYSNAVPAASQQIFSNINASEAFWENMQYALLFDTQYTNTVGGNGVPFSGNASIGQMLNKLMYQGYQSGKTTGQWLENLATVVLTATNGTTNLGKMFENWYNAGTYWFSTIANYLNPFSIFSPPSSWKTGFFLFSGWEFAFDAIPDSICIEVPPGSNPLNTVKKLYDVKIGTTAQGYQVGLAAYYRTDSSTSSTRNSASFPIPYGYDWSNRNMVDAKSYVPLRGDPVAAGGGTFDFTSTVVSGTDPLPTQFTASFTVQQQLGGSVFAPDLRPLNQSCAINEFNVNITYVMSTKTTGAASTTGVSWLELAVLADYSALAGYQIRVASYIIAIATYNSDHTYMSCGNDYGFGSGNWAGGVIDPPINTGYTCNIQLCLPASMFSMKPVFNWFGASLDVADFSTFFIWPSPTYPNMPFPFTNYQNSLQRSAWTPGSAGAPFTKGILPPPLPVIIPEGNKKSPLISWILCSQYSNDALARGRVDFGSGIGHDYAYGRAGYSFNVVEWFDTTFDLDYQRTLGDGFLQSSGGIPNDGATPTGYYIAYEWDHGCNAAAFIPMQFTVFNIFAAYN